MGYAEDIKRLVTMQDVAKAYGIHVNRMGFAECPFHREKTPSMKIYKDGGGWHCFGCGEGGDVISFVMKYYGISFKEACAKLNDDFNLGLPIGEKRTDRQRIADAAAAWRRKRVETEKKKAIEAAKSAHSDAYTRWMILSAICEKMRPEMADFPGDGFWAAAVMLLPQAEWELEQAEIRLYEAEHDLHLPADPV